MRKTVTQSHTTDYPNPISFLRGERLILGRRDEEYPGWIWTTTSDGNQGWAPEELIEVRSDGSGRALDTYTARELDVAVGDQLEVERELCGWVWVRKTSGDQGWIPASCLAIEEDTSTMEIRAETEADHQEVYQLLAAAFEQDIEAKLVDLLREQAQPLISLAASTGGQIVGHICFSPVTLDAEPDLVLMGLAPMAVTPQEQRRGIGSALVRAGLEECKKLGAHAVVVLGHPEYYPRFGFEPSTRFGIVSEYDVPEEVFMAQELVPDSLDQVSGTVRYHPGFAGV